MAVALRRLRTRQDVEENDREMLRGRSIASAGLVGLLTCCAGLEGGSLAAAAGLRTLAESEFETLDSPPILGVEAVARPTGSPLDVELGIYHHREDGVLPVTGDTEITGGEIALGIRKTFLLEEVSLRPYVAIGLAALYTDRDNQVSPIVGREGSDFDTGVYVRIGVDWIVLDQLFVGGDARWVQESNFDYGGYNLDGAALTLHVGWSF